MNGTNHATGAPLSPDGKEISLLDILQVVVANLRLLVIVPMMLGLLALAVTYVIRPTFTGITTIMPPLQQQRSAAMMLQSLGALGGLAGAATGIKNPNDQFVAFIKSDSIANRLIDKFQLVQRYDSEFKIDARTTLDSITRVTSGKDGLITIEVDDYDPAFSANLANAYVTELGELMKRLAITEAQQRRQFFEKQLTQTKNHLIAAEQALGSSGVNSASMKSSPEVAIKAIAELQARIAAQEVRLSTMRSYLTESSIDFKQAFTELMALRSQLAKAEANTAPMPSGSADANYIARYREVKYFETLFELFARQYELARSDEAREGTVIQIVDFALPPERRSKPKRVFTAVLTTLGTGLLLLFLVFLRHAIQGASAEPEAVKKLASIRSSWYRIFGKT